MIRIKFWCQGCNAHAKVKADQVTALLWQYLPPGWSMVTGDKGLPIPMCGDCHPRIDMSESWPQKLRNRQHKADVSKVV